jgi:hypothetical protein
VRETSTGANFYGVPLCKSANNISIYVVKTLMGFLANKNPRQKGYCMVVKNPKKGGTARKMKETVIHMAMRIEHWL